MQTLYVGLMSGTSADAVDAALVDLSIHPRLIAHYSCPISPEIRHRIHSLSLPSGDEIDRLGVLDAELAVRFAQATLELLSQAQVDASQITAIGSHGQTIRHRPPGSAQGSFTLQIGDPNLITELTGITTVADFRRRDMAAGGQGAPLVPAFHRAIFHTHHSDRVIVNIGGMANVTWLPASGQTLGFDTGPGNVLMDLWIAEHQGKSYDHSGAWAAQGNWDERLLANLLAAPFFAMQAPKSTGRETFNRAWLDSLLHEFTPAISPINVQATLLELTARSVCDSINGLSGSSKEIFVCGGGAYNSALTQRMKVLLPQDKIATTAALGVDPQWIEAMAFAWLAQQTLNRQPGNLCAVTGATRDVILGGVYYA